MKKIGLYGGTFDPIHFGHLNLAIELMEIEKLDETWFIPAHVSPHKVFQSPPVSLEHRLNMLELAVEKIPGCLVKNLEGERPPPSYTLRTLQLLLADYALHRPSDQFYLLLGEDSMSSFFRWRQPEEIIKLTPLLIGSRTGDWKMDSQPNAYEAEIKEAIEKGIRKTRLFDVSSVELRQRLQKNYYCGHLMPANVLDYINENHLYKSNY